MCPFFNSNILLKCWCVIKFLLLGPPRQINENTFFVFLLLYFDVYLAKFEFFEMKNGWLCTRV